MKFDDLDARMRVFETGHDLCVLPGIHVVARLDGRGFTHLTKVSHKFEAPFDERFRELMTHTTRHLMDCGLRTVYGYTQSDEISVLLHLEDDAFGRKERKLLSVLAAEASATFSLKLGSLATFDCRLCQLPGPSYVEDYFRWRQADANRNALNAHCYWIQRREGFTEREATLKLEGMSVAQKNEFLFRRGVNFKDLPAWQKRGIGVSWGSTKKKGFNPKTGKEVLAERRGLVVDLDLPTGEAFGNLLQRMAMQTAPA